GSTKAGFHRRFSPVLRLSWGKKRTKSFFCRSFKPPPFMVLENHASVLELPAFIELADFQA
ncbi:MAG TPA: hypothetical protein VLH40_00520, partial [Atribacteraceae bacterium]|nr:hypothetical protein [Atribacteraceae bacterium]